MEYVLVASRIDEASMCVYKALIELNRFRKSGAEFQKYPIYIYENVKLVLSDTKGIFMNSLNGFFCTNSVVFLSKHRSESGLPTLTAHFTGNFSDDVTYGGNPREIAWTDPALLTGYLVSLWSQKDRVSKYDIVLEATHHGPTSLNVPCLFIEIGSQKEEWEDTEAAALVAKVLLEAIGARGPVGKVGLGIGGPHYSRKLTNLVISEKVSLAGIVPKHSLMHLTDGIISQALEKSVEKVKYAFVDWKGLGTEKRRIMDLLQNHDLQVEKI